MVKNKNKGNKAISKSLAITMIAGIAFLLLFVYGTAGFLMFHYFRENPSQHPQPVEILPTVTEVVQAGENGGAPPQLIQPASENVNVYIQLESPLEVSLEQIASLKRGVVTVEAGENQGSGVVISSQGHVVTNFHVIEASPYMVRATVETPTGEMINRELMLLGYDTKKDLALLQFKNTSDLSLQPLPMGSIESVSEGQRIVAIGSFQEITNTVSDSIVSGIRRFESETYVQASAPISPVNSGGGLLNMKGELIGLITFKITEPDNQIVAISVDDLKLMIDSNPHWVNP